MIATVQSQCVGTAGNFSGCWRRKCYLRLSLNALRAVFGAWRHLYGVDADGDG